MRRVLSLSFVFFLALALYGCRSATDTKPEASNQTPDSTTVSKPGNEAPNAARPIPVDVARFAGKPAAELDKAFGAPLESSAIENGGEYRLYEIAGQSKGLAVRFYGGQAKSFNLILDKPVSTSKAALIEAFGIDVGARVPVREANEPLTESYRGSFGGVSFRKVSAKREAPGKGFVFVLAEVAE